MMNPYDDIINLPHHTSASRPHMSAYDRAAQFSPFAALTGYDSAITETARLTDKRAELDEYSKAALNEKLCMIQDQTDEQPEVSITYFQPDNKKSGGAYMALNRIAGIRNQVLYRRGLRPKSSGKSVWRIGTIQ